MNQHPRVYKLVSQREDLKHRFGTAATSQDDYGKLNRDITSERQRQRAALLKEIRDERDVENSVREIELQLSGFKFDQDVKASLDLADDMPLTQRRLVETIITLPGTTLEEETCRRNKAINAAAAHCKFQEGGAAARGRRGPGAAVPQTGMSHGRRHQSAGGCCRGREASAECRYAVGVQGEEANRLLPVLGRAAYQIVCKSRGPDEAL